jgi:hypothetical protein
MLAGISTEPGDKFVEKLGPTPAEGSQTLVSNPLPIKTANFSAIEILGVFDFDC